MGLSVARDVRNVPISLSYQEANELLKIFKNFDKDNDGHISTEMGETVSDDELRELIAEVDINKNCTIEEEEFLQVDMTCLGFCVSSVNCPKWGEGTTLPYWPMVIPHP